MMQYDEQMVLAAWKTFISKGVVPEGHVRPEIERSWQRCRGAGLDPWSVEFPPQEEETRRRLRKENRDFLGVAGPILDYLMALFGCNVSIADNTGFVYEFVSPLSTYSRTSGSRLTEEIVGTGNVPLALIEKKPLRVERFEHYRVISQDYAGVSAPLNGPDGEMFGLLNLNDPFGNLPAHALDTCVQACRMMEGFMRYADNPALLYVSPIIFQKLVDRFQNPVVVLDHDGMILLVNGAGMELLGLEKAPSPAAQSMARYLKDKGELAVLLNPDAEAEGVEAVLLKRASAAEPLQAQLLRRHLLQPPAGGEHVLLVFQSQTPAQEAPVAQEPSRTGAGGTIYIGESPAWKKVDEVVRRVSKYKSNVLLLGETGTGKEMVARSIHKYSGRTGEFVAVNCGAIPSALLGSELFGYTSGAFTGAKAGGAIGKFEYANGGTLLLDEIGEMPVDMQVSLLRVLQDHTITKIGSNKPQRIDVRLIAATNKDIPSLIAKGLFRSDLHYRLSVIEVKLPLLKDREGDIQLLAEYFSHELARSLQIKPTVFTPGAVEVMNAYDWPGNVRELRNIVEKLLIMADGRPITRDDFPEHILRAAQNPRVQPRRTPTTPDARLTRQQRKERERIRIIEMLETHSGNISRTAKALGVSRNTLYRKIKEYGIEMKVTAGSGTAE